MVWSYMSREGVGKFHLIEGKMDKYVYCNILEMAFVDTIQMQEENQVILQHDSDPKHTTNYAID